MTRSSVRFFVNGRPHEVEGKAAFASLSEYLRDHLRLTGTKIVCAEGDCGACSVLVGRPTLDGQRLRYRAVDACIALLPQLDATHIVTVEGLAAEDGTMTAVQSAMIDCHGSQCGFCTPGFVTTMHGMLEPDAGECCSRDDVALGLSGNLCRCTGYQQILEAFEQARSRGVAAMNARYDEASMLQTLNDLRCDEVVLSGGEMRACVPRTIEAVLAYKSEHPAARLISGSTDIGVQRTHGRFHDQDWLVLTGIDELSRIGDGTVKGRSSISIGAGATWTEVLDALDERFVEFDPILKRFGSPQIRNMASIGGNLVNASPIADSIPFLFVAEATLTMRSAGGGVRNVRVDEFYRGYKDVDLRPDEIVTAVHLPLPHHDEFFKLYKFSKRNDMDISTMTAAFRLTIRDSVVHQARIALGGVGPTVVRIPDAEKALIGKPFDRDNMLTAGELAAAAITPIDDVRGKARYRQTLARNVFLKCHDDLSDQPLGASA